ncbi:family 16 glycosylhydrolase [Asticcacaulis machinosus]|uniref:Family 16 glycosylhydrolase n=1 Tax=Asticcacaulis machinosus TaxID=2984211 RepID=A0ABT5HJV5_9CAUL|nr:family 16 glycosylhydrolase [Asticcacaulis machinosus]MDC7676435.1 family 16 glycosylhydrolase [Asticcacaulis machinosus]
MTGPLLRRFFIAALASASLPGMPFATAQSTTPPPPNVTSPDVTGAASFVDRFDRLDLSRWYVAHGWSNGPHQNCGWSHHESFAHNGKLKLRFQKKPMADRLYSCGEVQTRATYGYGTYEARMKTPKGSGLNGAFFTYIGPTHGKPHDEIDWEVLLKDTTVAQTGGYVNAKGVGATLPKLPYPADSDFLDYAFVWAPDSLKYYVNGKLVHTISSPAPLPSNAQKIFFSLWGSNSLTDWMGTFIEPSGPLVMEVDWVAYTRPGDACQFPDSLVCKLNGA